jgi:transcription antitermination factor NusG
LQGFRSGREIHADLEPGSAELPGLQTRCWFAVYTTCRHEKKVSLYLRHRAIEHYLPLYQSERKWKDGSRVTLELPLFPGYMFVHIAQSERTGVLGVPGAVALVDGTGGAPAPIPDGTIRALQRGLKEHRVEPHPLLTVGQTVRICAGSFAGMEGVVVRRRNGLRVVLTLGQIAQSLAVEVSEGDVEPLAAPPRPIFAVPDANRRILQSA